MRWLQVERAIDLVNVFRLAERWRWNWQPRSRVISFVGIEYMNKSVGLAECLENERAESCFRKCLLEYWKRVFCLPNRSEVVTEREGASAQTETNEHTRLSLRQPTSRQDSLFSTQDNNFVLFLSKKACIVPR